MNTMQHRLPQLGREISKFVGSSNLSRLLLRGWAALTAVIYGLLSLNPPIAARYWLVLLVAGIGLSIVLSIFWLRQANQQQHVAAKPWILHWSGVLVVVALQLFHSLQNSTESTIYASTIASQCLLLGGLGLMTAGFYLRSSLLPAGLALCACYLGMTMLGPWGGIITGVVCAAFLWSSSNEPAG